MDNHSAASSMSPAFTETLIMLGFSPVSWDLDNYSTASSMSPDFAQTLTLSYADVTILYHVTMSYVDPHDVVI